MAKPEAATAAEGPGRGEQRQRSPASEGTHPVKTNRPLQQQPSSRTGSARRSFRRRRRLTGTAAAAATTRRTAPTRSSRRTRRGDRLGLVPAWSRSSTCSTRPRRRPGLLDQRRPGQRRVHEVPHLDRGEVGRARRHHARVRGALELPIRDALVDLTEYGANDVKDNYSEGAWKDVSSGDAVYAIPVDGGPMGMLYRKDIFEEYGIAVPTTWESSPPPRSSSRMPARPRLRRLPDQRPRYNQALLRRRARCRSSTTPRTRRDRHRGQRPGVQGRARLLGRPRRARASSPPTTRSPPTTTPVSSTAPTPCTSPRPGGPATCRRRCRRGADAGRVGRRSAAAVGRRQPGAGELGRLDLRRDQPGDRTASSRRRSPRRSSPTRHAGGRLEEAPLPAEHQTCSASDDFQRPEYPFFDGQQINKDVFLPAGDGYTGFTFSPFQNYYDQLHGADRRDHPGRDRLRGGR